VSVPFLIYNMSLLWLKITKRKPSRATTTSTLFVVSKDEWDTKEGTGKPMKNVLYILKVCQKALLGLKREKIKLIALAIVKLRWSGRQAGS